MAHGPHSIKEFLNKELDEAIAEGVVQLAAAQESKNKKAADRLTKTLVQLNEERDLRRKNLKEIYW